MLTDQPPSKETKHRCSTAAYLYFIFLYDGTDKAMENYLNHLDNCPQCQEWVRSLPQEIVMTSTSDLDLGVNHEK
jgi:hypothetical protein